MLLKPAEKNVQIADRRDRFFSFNFSRTKVRPRPKEKRDCFLSSLAAAGISVACPSVASVLIGGLFSQEKFI